MRILVLAAHPDDVEYFIGGTLLRHTHSGDRVSIAYYTHGEEEERGALVDPARTRLRAREATDAATTLGITDILFLGYANKSVPTDARAIQLTTAVLDDARPDIVYAPKVASSWAGWHPDHRAVGRLVQHVHRAARLPFPLHLYGGYRPAHLVDISHYRERIERAINQHQSQRLTLRWAVPIRTLHTRRLGRQLGVRHAEGHDVIPPHA